MAALAGDPAAAESDLRAAITALDAFGAPFTLAQAELSLSVLLARTGREGDAGEWMSQAREIFESLGAEAWLARTTADQLSEVPG
jgi:hypothetical protein